MNIYLTDEQYKEILQKIKLVVDDPSFEPYCYDSTEIGNKYNETNCGFCNNDFTTKDTALFPKYFPERKTIKYRRVHQVCPFDTRAKGQETLGCFYFCMIFNLQSVDRLRIAVNEAIKWAKENIK